MQPVIVGGDALKVLSVSSIEDPNGKMGTNDDSDNAETQINEMSNQFFIKSTAEKASQEVTAEAGLLKVPINA